MADFKGTLKNGFKFTIKETVMDDYEILELLEEIDDGETGKIPKLATMLLGEKQKDKLKDHIRDDKGRVASTEMIRAIDEIFNLINAGKKS